MGRALSPPGPYERLSLWHDTVDTDWTPRPALAGDVEADVAIVGAGLHRSLDGLLPRRGRPRRCGSSVLEAETAGFGASGRNGGWCSALFPASLATLAGLRRPRRPRSPSTAAMRATVDEVVRVAAAEGIDADFAKGGTITLARSRAAVVARRRPRSPTPARWGRGEDDLRLLDRAGGDRDPARQPHPSARRTPPTARRSTPRAWSAAWPTAVERRGVTIHEQTRVTAIEPRLARTEHGDGPGRAPCCARPRATPRRSPGERRTMVPVYSLIIATEPLPAEVWDEIGLAPARDVHRPPAPDHLRPAHRRRPAGLRRPRRAVPPRLADPARVRPRREGLRAALRHARRPVPGARRHPGHPRLGRRARHPARLVRLGRPRPARPGSAGPAGTSATASAPPTSPGARCATWCSAATPT